MTEAMSPMGVSREGIAEELCLGSLEDRPLDRLARVGAGLMGVPAVAISIESQGRQKVLGVFGLPAPDPVVARPGSPTPCGVVVASGREQTITDLREDPTGRTWETFELLGLRSYAGIPIRSSEGVMLGAVGAFDAAPRTWTTQDLDRLRDVAGLVERELETRRSFAARERAEHHYRRLFETSPAGVYILDRAGRLSEVNPALASLCGGQPEDLLGRHMSEFVAPRDRAAVAARFRARLSGERTGVTDTEFWLLTLNGEERLCHLRTGSVVEGGVVTGSHGVLRDVTAERATAEALLASESRFRSLVEQSLAGIYIVRDGWFVYANPRLAEMFGYNVLELERVAAIDLVDAADRDRVLAMTEGIDGGGAPDRGRGNYTFRGRRKDGSIIEVEIHGSRVHVDGRPAIMGLALDVTERREAEARFRQIAESIRDAFWITDADGDTLVYASPAYEEMFGPASVTGPFYRWLDAVHPDDRDRASAAFATTRLHAGEYDEEYRLLRAGGEVRWVRDRAYPVRDERGVVTRITGIVEDITERKRAEAVVRESETHYRLMVEGSDQVFFFSHDTEGRFVYLSESVEAVLGFAPSELLGQRYDTLHDSRDEVASLNTGAALASGLPQPAYTAVVTRKDGTPAYLEITEVPECEDGVVVALRGFARDVTRRKQLEEQLHQANKMEAVGQLAGGVAHDFNNLLTSIQGHVHLAIEAVPERSPVRDDLREIRRSSERAAELTRQLLAFSRKQVLHPTVLDLNAVVLGLEKMLQRLIGDNITIETVLEAEHPWILADAGQIEQVIVNLVVNARDAMPDGGRLVVRTSDIAVGKVTPDAPGGTAPEVRLSVSDSGTGMAPETQARIFDPFFTTKEQGKGTGLGLATVYGIVTQSGGSITVDSAVGRGSTFHVDLARTEQPAAPSLTVPISARHGGTETVLVVEDEAGVRQLCRRVLERNGYRVLAAEDGAAAVREIEASERTVELVLSDVVMPGLTGRELVRAIRDIHPGVPIVFMSGYAEEAVERHGVVEQGTLFLEKPFSPDALLRMVRTALDIHRVVDSGTVARGPAPSHLARGVEVRPE